MKGSVNNLVVTDTIEFNLADYNDVEEAQLKFVLNNDFPADILVQAILLDDADNVLDILFQNNGLLLEASELGIDDKTIPGAATIHYLDIDRSRYQVMQRASRIAIVASINTKNESNENLWFYSDYAIDFKIGGIFTLIE